MAAVLAGISLTLTLVTKNSIWANVFFGTLTLSLLLVLARIVYFIFQKGWSLFLRVLASICICIAGLVSINIFLFIVGEMMPDYYASNHKIPAGIEISEPIDVDDQVQRDSIENVVRSGMDLQVYGSGGVYYYDFWIGRIEPGVAYLKAFEITENDPLSEESVQKLRIHIGNNTDTIRRFSSSSDFTIYEGDWGNYYAARFEVWFKPNNGTKERLLMTKNYKIEGWMR